MHVLSLKYRKFMYPFRVVARKEFSEETVALRPLNAEILCWCL